MLSSVNNSVNIQTISYSDERKKGYQGRLHSGGDPCLEERAVDPKNKEEKNFQPEAARARPRDISNTNCMHFRIMRWNGR